MHSSYRRPAQQTSSFVCRLRHLFQGGAGPSGHVKPPPSSLLLLLVAHVLVNVRTLPEARFGWGVSRGQGVPRAFGKVVWGWPPGFAADAGAMQIQLGKGRGLRGAEAALRSMALHCHGQSCLEPKKRNEDGRCRGLRGNRCGGKVGECGTRRGTQSFRVGESGSCRRG
jgi:hypothetical protein